VRLQFALVEAGEARRLEQLPDGFCVMPFMALQVDTLGEIAPCCVYGGKLGHVDDGLPAVWATDEWAELRDRFLRGDEVPGCWKCIERERTGGTSLRLRRNAEFLDRVVAEPADAGSAGREVVITAASSPMMLDLRFSNRCNLKCRTCWHGASSRWYADAKALGMSVGPVAEIESFAPGEVLDGLAPLLPSLSMIYFAGGEPLLAPDHALLLRHLISLGRTDIVLEYNSNMTLSTSDSWDVFELWEQFDRVMVEASVDGVGDVGALVRSGFDWATFCTNVDELRRRVPSAELRFGITVSAINVAHVPELVRTLRSRWPDVPQHVHHVASPPHYRLGVLPASSRRSVAAEIRRLVDELEAEDADGEVELVHALTAVVSELNGPGAPGLQRARFRTVTVGLDERRHESTVAVIPELAPALRARWTTSVRAWARPLARRIVPAPVRRRLVPSRVGGPDREVRRIDHYRRRGSD
jgi:MoaA/NifB/PqqE/SkfB family radical SAM enzyme